MKASQAEPTKSHRKPNDFLHSLGASSWRNISLEIENNVIMNFDRPLQANSFANAFNNYPLLLLRIVGRFRRRWRSGGLRRERGKLPAAYRGAVSNGL